MKANVSAFFKKHFFDLLTGVVLFGVTAGLMTYYLWPSSPSEVEAKVYHKADLQADIDLWKETAERTFLVEGTHGTVTIGVKPNAIAILESNCPNQYCVEEGYVSSPQRSVICAYNEIYIFLEGVSAVDVIVG